MAKGYILKNPRVVLVCSCSIPHQEARVLLARPVRRARPRLNSDDAGQTDVLQSWIGTPSDEEVMYIEGPLLLIPLPAQSRITFGIAIVGL